MSIKASVTGDGNTSVTSCLYRSAGSSRSLGCCAGTLDRYCAIWSIPRGHLTCQKSCNEYTNSEEGSCR